MALTYRSVKGSPLTIEEIDSNFAYFTGSHSITGSLTISGSLYTTEPLLITGSLLPVDSGGTALGSPELYFGELYLSTASVNFMGQPGALVASIKAFGEGNTYYEPASGMVYIAPWYTSGSSVVPKLLRGSFGVGTGSIAIGTGSVTLGRYLSAFGNHQTVVGAFNQTSSADFAFIIGNGTSTSNRSNLLFASASQVQVTGSLVISGAAALSGNISFTTSGSGVIQTLTKVIPNGTSSYAGFSNTTASVNFGLNLITTANPQNYCAKLPQPVTGKSVTVINKSGIEIKLFPSNAGGDINGITNGFTIIPSDGRSYVFNCYENPLPGGWSVVTQNSTTTTLSSGVISSSLNGWLNPTDQPYVWSFINQDYQATGSGASMNSHYSFLNYNQYGIVGPNQVGFPNYSPNGAGSWILPSNPGTLTSIRIITNLKYDTNYFQIGLSITGRKLFLDHATINNVANPMYAWAYVNTSTDSGYATWRDNTWLPWIAQNPGNTPYVGIDVDNFTSVAHYPYANITTTSTPGTFIPGPGVSGSILAANPGDPGTMIFNLDMTIPMISLTNDTFPSFTNLGVTAFPGAFVNSSNQLIDAFWVKDFGITLQNMNWNNYYPDLKIIPQYTFSI